MIALTYIFPLIESISIFQLIGAGEFFDLVFIPFIVISILFCVFMLLRKQYRTSRLYNNVISVINLIVLLVWLPEYIMRWTQINGFALEWGDYTPIRGVYGIIIIITVIIYQVVKLFLLNNSRLMKVTK